MSSFKHKLETLLNLVQNPEPQALRLALNDVHAEGVLSIPVKGESGSLTRFFIAQKPILPYQV